MAIWCARANPHPQTHTQYVILTAFTLQQRLQERASMLSCSPLPDLVTPTIRCIKKQSRSVIDMTYTEQKQTHSYVIFCSHQEACGPTAVSVRPHLITRKPQREFS
jgi:hypothetical protein